MNKILQNKGSFEKLLSQVKCNLSDMNFEFVIREQHGEYSLHIKFGEIDNTSSVSNNIKKHHKNVLIGAQIDSIWPLQNTMCDSEVIRTAWMATVAVVMHRLEETFGLMDEMVKMRKQKNIDQIQVLVDEDEIFRAGTLINDDCRSVLAIRYPHFVATLGEFRVTTDECNGGYRLDLGTWRNKGLGNKRGVEFELFSDAEKFIENYGGEYSRRHLN